MLLKKALCIGKIIDIFQTLVGKIQNEERKIDYVLKKSWISSKQGSGYTFKALSKKNPNLILAGDFNIIPSEEDVYNVKSFEDDALYRLEIRKKFREMINLGFNDVFRYFNEDKEGYTFWDYMRGAWQKNNGMRIDHFLVSNSLIDQIKDINTINDLIGFMTVFKGDQIVFKSKKMKLSDKGRTNKGQRCDRGEGKGIIIARINKTKRVA